MLDEHLLADPGKRAFELAEAAGAVTVELPQDERLPLARHHVHGRVDPADVRPTPRARRHHDPPRSRRVLGYHVNTYEKVSIEQKGEYLSMRRCSPRMATGAPSH